ncbi:MAG: NACHT domain-containing protein, partial [Acidobacteriota bacterium]
MVSQADGKTITLLHLSDLHARASTEWDAKRVTRTLVDDLKELARTNLRPDLVLFTGDLAWKGTGREFSLGWRTIAAVQAAYEPPIEDEAIFLVPGNHDVDRTKVGDLEAIWLQSANQAAVTKLIADGGRSWKQLTARLEPYRRFLKRRKLDHLRTDANRAIWHARRTLADTSIGLAGFNTAWTCGADRENGRLWMGAHWQHATLHEAVHDAKVRIALLHHPPSWLHEHEAPAFAEALQRDFHLVLHGHRHRAWVRGGNRGHATLEAAACYDRSDHDNGYSLIQLDLDAKQVHVHLREYRAGGWVKRCVPRDAPDGVWTLDAPWLDDAPDGESASAASTAAAAPALDAAHAEAFATFRAHQYRKNAWLPLTGFPASARIPLTLESVYVPLRAWQREHGLLHERDAKGARKEIDAELAEALSEGEEVPFEQAFRKAQARDLRGAVVLGDPGSGKTTLLKHFLLTEPATLGLPRGTLPILVLLRSLPDPGAGLRPAVAHALQQTCTNFDDADAQALAIALLQHGHLLLLLDGLDEVANADDRAAIATWLEDEIAARTTCFFVLTSRYAGYRADARLSSRFLELHVRQLAVDEAKTFIGNWYGAVVDRFGKEPDGSPATPADATRRADALAAQIFDVPEARITNLQELATNPLMLQILCLLFWDQGHLPGKRVELYEACVKTLLDLWRRGKRLRPAGDASSIGYVDALAVLRPLAWRLQQAGVRELPEAAVIEAVRGPLRARRGVNLSPEQFLDHVREVTGVLVLLGRGDYGFLHLSFQEYLAALHVQDRFAEAPDVLDALAANFGESWWREVILLSLGLTGPSVFNKVMTHLVDSQALSRDPLLASDCLRDAAEPSARPLLAALERGIDDADERFQVLRLLKSDAL